jgi:hypothetical protein
MDSDAVRVENSLFLMLMLRERLVTAYGYAGKRAQHELDFALAIVKTFVDELEAAHQELRAG